MQGKNALDFGGGDVLALPAEGVPGAVHELEMLEADLAHQVTGVEVAIAGLEDVLEDRGLGLLLLGIADERGGRGDLADEQAGLALLHLLHEAVGAAQGLLGFLVVLDDDRVAAAEAHGVVEVEDVQKGDVALAGGVELVDVVDAEAASEFLPDGRAQAVADHHAHRVVGVVGLRRAIKQIAAELADIAEAGALIALDVVPEAAGAETPADDQRGWTGDDRAPAHQKASGVIERQGEIETIGGAHAGDQVAEATVRRHPAQVIGDRGFGHAGGARGVDIE